ncbi:glycosyltransferase [Paenibacillus protaetiae]|uniref:Colanic acid biosynthesis glycosyltransferase WcaL n=1 Tax=Paenibacillus protaetiae TaxID=2509456 RepID=A0A4P6F9P1_9BACL|nr:glycosyltransferase [Paenibacillus protaetiae]QAY67208.1 colanic acid biosynthesis glycosyltransferase WcaL [Paenibacillus protaetiae]
MKKLNIAFIIGQFPSLSETFILNQITGLLDRGHRVDIYASRPAKTGKMHQEVVQYHLLDRCIYDDMPGSRAQCMAAAATIVMRKPRLAKLFNAVKYGKEALSLRALFIADKMGGKTYDVIYCHFGDLGKIGALLKETGVTNAQIATTFHGRDVSAYLDQKGADAYKLLFQKGDLFMPISENWKSKLIRLGCDPDKTIVHRMGIDTGKFSYIPRMLEAGEKVRLVTVARLVEKKGVEYGIRGVAEALKHYPHIEYAIIGDGPLKAYLQGVVSDLGVQDHVFLLGSKEQHEVIQVLNQSHIMLAPSVTASDGDQEGIPVVLMEALSMGLPVISTLHSGIPEVVSDGQSGYLVPEKDSMEIARTILYMAGHAEEWADMGRFGRQFVENHYSIDGLNDRLVQLFQAASSQEAFWGKEAYDVEYSHH